MTSIRISGPAGALSIDDAGDGATPVLFVHSLAGTAGQWAAQLEHLRTARRAAALDLRGHGRSEPPRDGDSTVEGASADVGAALDALRMERAILVGHSFGGGVALAYAARHPDRVAGLLLVDAIADASATPADEARGYMAMLESDDYAQVVDGYWTQIAGPDERVRERLLRDLRATPRRVVVEGFRSVLRFDARPLLAAYAGPRRAIVTPLNDTPASLHALGGFPHTMIEGTGHWPHLERPARFNALLDDFIGEVEGRG